jgi:hypothetical protein
LLSPGPVPEILRRSTEASIPGILEGVILPHNGVAQTAEARYLGRHSRNLSTPMMLRRPAVSCPLKEAYDLGIPTDSLQHHAFRFHRDLRGRRPTCRFNWFVRTISAMPTIKPRGPTAPTPAACSSP